jgi:hypothetical protein
MYLGLSIVNVLSFFFFNYFFICALVWMVYKIRHCNDSTKIKTECSVVVGWWIISNFPLFVIYLIIDLKTCQASEISIWASATTL